MRALALVASSLLAVSAPLVGQQPRDTTSQSVTESQNGNATVSGIVVAAGPTPTPLRRALVVLNGGDPSLDRSGVTDDGGRFTFDHLAPARYTLTASKPAYLSTAYGAKRPGGTGTPISLSSGQRLRDLTITLARGGVISGVVHDAEGRPESGVQISVLRIGQPPPRNLGLPGSPDQIVTDDRGEYRAYGLAPGEYLVAGVGSSPGGGSIAIRRSEEVDAIFRDLEQRAPSGRVANVPAQPPSAGAPANADERNFTLAPTYYPGTPSPAEAAHVPVAAGSERSGVDFTVVPVPAVSIEGTIAGWDAREPVLLAISNGTETAFGLSAATSAPRLTVRPGADGTGRFVYTNVTPGHYTILARTTTRSASVGAAAGRGGGVGIGGGAAAVPPGADLQWALAEVIVSGFDVAGVTLALQPSLTFSGHLAFESASGSRPRDLSGVRVQLTPTSGSPMSVGGGGTIGGTVIGLPVRNGYGLVTADGAFAVRGLLPGPYDITVSLPNWRLDRAIADDKDLLDAPLDLQAGTTIGDAVLTFSDRHNELGGRLRTPSGAAAPDYTILVFPVDRARWTSPRRVLATRPANDGRFAFADVPAGDYYLAALTDLDPNDLRTPAFLEEVAPAAVKVTLGNVERKQQDLQIGR